MTHERLELSAHPKKNLFLIRVQVWEKIENAAKCKEKILPCLSRHFYLRNSCNEESYGEKPINFFHLLKD